MEMKQKNHDYLVDKIKSMSVPEILNWLVDDAIRNGKEDEFTYLKFSEDIKFLHDEIHRLSNSKKVEILEKKLYDLWKSLPKSDDLVSKSYLDDLIKNYYTINEADSNFYTESITNKEILRTANKVFGS